MESQVSKIRNILIEVAAFTPGAALDAFHAGADRIELCSGYTEGGLSPSAATIAVVRENVSIPVHVMVRPRIGDFIYTHAEKEIMLRDIHYCKTQKIDGIVAGALNEDGDIDTEFTLEMVKAAQPMTFTFHRAFDICNSLPNALEKLINCGVNRVLTSGGESSCMAGIQRIEELLKMASNRIVILPGGGIKPENIERLIQVEGISEIHLSGKQLVKSKMSDHGKLSLTSKDEFDDYHWYEFDPSVLAAIRNKLDQITNI